MTHEDYVSFEQAKALKELGFDWEVFFQFNYKTKEIEPNEGNSYSEGGPFDTYDVLTDVTKCGCIPAPTLAQAQKWVRETKGIDISSVPTHPYGKKQYRWALDRWSPELKDWGYNLFDTYEQALSAGIDMAIEILKEEKTGSTYIGRSPEALQQQYQPLGFTLTEEDGEIVKLSLLYTSIKNSQWSNPTLKRWHIAHLEERIHENLEKINNLLMLLRFWQSQFDHLLEEQEPLSQELKEENNGK